MNDTRGHRSQHSLSKSFENRQAQSERKRKKLTEGGAGGMAGEHENERLCGQYDIGGAIYNDPVKRSRSLNTRYYSSYSLNRLL